MISLVQITPADFPKLISWAVSKEFLLQWTGRTFTFPLDEKQLNDYYILSTGKNPLRAILKAVDEISGEHIGNITIDWVKSKIDEAGLTCIIVGDDKYKGRGVGSEIVDGACRISFEQLGMKKLYLNVFEFNKSAVKCYRQCGFKEVFRESIRVNGKKYVNIRMELEKGDALASGEK